MYTRMTIILTEDERVALQAMAEEHCRYPRDEVRWLIREAYRTRQLSSIEVLSTREKEHAASARRSGDVHC
jgi:hypothetical protein